VGAGEDHHVLQGEVLGRELVDEGLRCGAGRGQVDGVRRVGHAAVAPAGGDLVRDAPGEADAVAGGEGHDVGARHGARAALLNGGLGGVDHVEAAEARVVWHGVTLGLAAARVHGEEDGGITALHSRVGRRRSVKNTSLIGTKQIDLKTFSLSILN